jgi:hypothetical protein
MNTKTKLEMISKKEKISVILAVIRPEATGRLNLTSFSRSASRSKYWFKTKTLAVASEKARKTIEVISKGDTQKRTLPKPKLKIHPSQLPTLAASKY